MVKMAAREAYGRVLAELVKENKRVLVLDVDLSGFTKTGEVKKAAPEQHFNFSITEGNMTTTAAGMAISGNIAFANTFAMFIAGHAFEQVRDSICYPHLNVKMCAAHAGLIVGKDGASHQGVEDIALMRNIPDMVVVSPADRVETKATIHTVTEYDGLCYICLSRMAAEDIHTEDTLNFQIGKRNVVHKGDSVALIATGIMAEAAMKAADILRENGIDIMVADMYAIRPIDEGLIVELTRDHDLFVTREEHSIIGDLDSAVAEVLSQKTLKKLAMVRIKGTFGESGAPAALLGKYGPTANGIVKAVGDNKQIIG